MIIVALSNFSVSLNVTLANRANNDIAPEKTTEIETEWEITTANYLSKSREVHNLIRIRDDVELQLVVSKYTPQEVSTISNYR